MTRYSIKKVLGLSLLAIYLPYLVMVVCLFVSTTCRHCHIVGLSMWPIMPGGMMCLLFFRNALPHSIAVVLGVLLTVTMIAGMTVLGRRGKTWLMASLLAGCLVSCWLACVAYAVIRA